MLASLRLTPLFSCHFRSLLIVTLLLATLTAWAQKPLLYLSVSNPAGPLLINSTTKFDAVVAPFRQTLQANGYRVITQPDTLRHLLAQPAAPPFLYADIVCYQRAGGYPTVVFAVRDTLNVPWFISRESTRVFLGQGKGFNSAADYLASQLPAAFTPRFAEAPALTDRAPQFMAYDNFQFTTYLESVLYTKSVRQQLKQGAALELAIQVDELGGATLQEVGGQLTLDGPTRQRLEAAVRATPPWAPALQNGRRTATVVRLKLQHQNR